MTLLDQFSLKTKVAVVTGGEGLLGRCICETIRELGGTALSLDLKPTADHVIDITDAAAVARLSDEAGDVDILVNCAVGNQKPLTDVGEGFSSDLNIGLVGAMVKKSVERLSLNSNRPLPCAWKAMESFPSPAEV